MIELPDFNKAFNYENNFYLSCDLKRIGKIICSYELYKIVRELPGDIVECGVFKGISLIRLITFRELFKNSSSKKVIGFDTFGKFPETEFSDDMELRKKFIDTAGEESISKEQLEDVIKKKGIYHNTELVKGDITETVPKYVAAHPELRISILHLDVDIYEPSVTVLDYLYPRLVKGGVLMLDDYGIFPGETKAVDDYFKDKDVQILKFPFAMTPSYIIK